MVCFLALAPLVAGAPVHGGVGAGQPPVTVVVHIFHTATCPHCARALRFLEQLAAVDDRLALDSRELIAGAANARAFEAASRRHGIDPPAVPLMLIGEQAVLGYDADETTGAELTRLIRACQLAACRDIGAEIIQAATAGKPQDPTPELAQASKPRRPALPDTIAFPLLGEIAVGSLSLPVLTVLLAALDGFNPCAMWVLIFLIGLLLGIQDRLRMWTYGAVFLLTSALVYLAFMAAWLNLFLLVGSLWWIRSAVALVAIGASGAYLWQFITNPEGACLVTTPGERQRTMDRLTAVVTERSFPVAVAGLIVLATAVNLIELICSAGVPAVYTEILSQAGLAPLAHYGYLALYIVIFLLDDAVVFVTAMVTLRASGLAGTYARIAHLIGAVVLAVIGVLLLLRPEWLAFA